MENILCFERKKISTSDWRKKYKFVRLYVLLYVLLNI